MRFQLSYFWIRTGLVYHVGTHLKSCYAVQMLILSLWPCSLYNAIPWNQISGSVLEIFLDSMDVPHWSWASLHSRAVRAVSFWKLRLLSSLIGKLAVHSDENHFVGVQIQFLLKISLFKLRSAVCFPVNHTCNLSVGSIYTKLSVLLRFTFACGMLYLAGKLYLRIITQLQW